MSRIILIAIDLIIFIIPFANSSDDTDLIW